MAKHTELELVQLNVTPTQARMLATACLDRALHFQLESIGGPGGPGMEQLRHAYTTLAESIQLQARL